VNRVKKDHRGRTAVIGSIKLILVEMKLLDVAILDEEVEYSRSKLVVAVRRQSARIPTIIVDSQDLL